MEDWAEGRVRDSFFMFREVRGLLGVGKTNESESEVADERPAELSLWTRAMSELRAGVSIRKEVRGPLFRWAAGGRDRRDDDGRGVAESMLLSWLDTPACAVALLG